MSDAIEGKESCLRGAVHINAKNIDKNVGAIKQT